MRGRERIAGERTAGERVAEEILFYYFICFFLNPGRHRNLLGGATGAILWQ